MSEQTMIPARDGFPLSVHTGGPGDGPTLLLLQGQANSHTWWDGLREGFESTHRTISFDYRGTGGSRGRIGEVSTSSFAADAIDVLDGLGVDRAAVYGTSMGGRIAQLLALDFPDRVSAIVLACTSPGGPHAVRRPREVGRALARLRGAEHTAYLHSLFYTPAAAVAPSSSTLLGDATMSAEESAAHLRISARHDAWERLPEITAPTLIVHGDADLMNPVGNAHLLHERIPGSRLAITSGGRHGFFAESAAEVTSVIRGFLDDAHA